jgi:hypothetical protein
MGGGRRSTARLVSALVARQTLITVTRVGPDGGLEAEPVVVDLDDDGSARITLDDGEALVLDADSVGELRLALND